MRFHTAYEKETGCPLVRFVNHTAAPPVVYEKGRVEVDVERWRGALFVTIGCLRIAKSTPLALVRLIRCVTQKRKQGGAVFFHRNDTDRFWCDVLYLGGGGDDDAAPCGQQPTPDQADDCLRQKDKALAETCLRELGLASVVQVDDVLADGKA